MEVQNLSLRRGRRTLIDGASFAVEVGELVHLQGSNGSGKTSLIRAAAGLDERFEGRISVLGERPTTRRSDIAFAPAGDLVWQTMTAEQQLKRLLSMFGATKPWPPAAGLVECIGDEFGKTGGFWLSSGQRRMLTLASVLSIPARLVLLDEPLNFLSVEWAVIVTDSIRGACEAGAAALVCSHGNTFAGARQLVLANGSIDRGVQQRGS